MPCAAVTCKNLTACLAGLKSIKSLSQEGVEIKTSFLISRCTLHSNNKAIGHGMASTVLKFTVLRMR